VPTHGRWSLVLGSFSSRQQAEQAEQRWKALHPRISEAAGIDRVYYRVLAGDYARRDAAEAALKPLRRKPDFKDAWALQLP
jgi:septal ring-binding cell division protein DamX